MLNLARRQRRSGAYGLAIGCALVFAIPRGPTFAVPASVLNWASNSAPSVIGRAVLLAGCNNVPPTLQYVAGLCVELVAVLPAKARHIAVRANGDLVVAAYPMGVQETTGVGGVYILSDRNGDGRYSVKMRFGDPAGGTGLAVKGESIYFASDRAVVRFDLSLDAGVPPSAADTVVTDLPFSRSHRAKSIVVIGSDLYVNVPAPSNACQRVENARGSPGIDPCPQLRVGAGIWKFDAGGRNQRLSDGMRFATGIRNVLALTADHQGRLFGVQHGRDRIFELWSHTGLFSARDGAELPSEELLRIEEGDNFGWPYCYHDPWLDRKVLAPEYGGNGSEIGRCSVAKLPEYSFPAHWAPSDMLITDSIGPIDSRFREGMFVVFHGSWNRAPLPQEGFFVAFLPKLAGGGYGEGVEVIVDGFAGSDKNRPIARPMGIAQAPDGSLFLSDDVGGRIWRIYSRDAGR